MDVYKTKTIMIIINKPFHNNKTNTKFNKNNDNNNSNNSNNPKSK